jgi:hypothetical protein
MEAERMANFAQSLAMEERPSRALGRQVNAIEETQYQPLNSSFAATKEQRSQVH